MKYPLSPSLFPPHINLAPCLIPPSIYPKIFLNYFSLIYGPYSIPLANGSPTYTACAFLAALSQNSS